MKKYFILVAVCANFIFLSLTAQRTTKERPPVYMQQMNALFMGIEKNFFDSASGYYKLDADSVQRKDPYTYLWSLCALFQAANEMERLEPGRVRNVWHPYCI